MPLPKYFWFAVIAIIFHSVTLSAASVNVLCYHTFMGKPKIPTDFSIAELQEQVKQFKDNGFKFVSFSDMINNKITGTKNILITIDDGYQSAYDAYKTVLKPNGIAPLFAIYPGVISHKKISMKWEQIKELANEPGVTIAAHGFYHLYVNEKLYKKNQKEFEDEIFKVKKVLEEKTGKKITTYCYPFGLYSPITIEYLKKAGYQYAFTIKPGSNATPVAAGNYEIRRFYIERNSVKSTIKRILKSA